MGFWTELGDLLVATSDAINNNRELDIMKDRILRDIEEYNRKAKEYGAQQLVVKEGWKGDITPKRKEVETTTNTMKDVNVDSHAVAVRYLVNLGYTRLTINSYQKGLTLATIEYDMANYKKPYKIIFQ